MSDPLSSCIYQGTVRHRRYQHAKNAFKFSAFMFLLDLEELDRVFVKRWFWSTNKFNYAHFCRRDHFKRFAAQRPLRDCAVDVLQDAGVKVPLGRIRLLTQLRYCGFRMNPVSFYYCFDRSDTQVIAIIVEVNNTPWGEQHIYVVDAQSNSAAPGIPQKRITVDKLKKAFHVSPFMDLEMDYRMLFSLPGENLGIKMENRVDGKKVFDVSMSLKRKPLNGFELAKVLVQFPLYSVKVFAGIYYQALKLYLKRVPFVPHPDKNKTIVVNS